MMKNTSLLERCLDSVKSCNSGAVDLIKDLEAAIAEQAKPNNYQAGYDAATHMAKKYVRQVQNELDTVLKANRELRGKVQAKPQEPVAEVKPMAVGMPGLQWLSDEIAASTPVGTKLYTRPQALDQNAINKCVLAVAITQLYDTHPNDVANTFSLGELIEVSQISESMRPRQVEDIYKEAWDSICKGAALEPMSEEEIEAVWRTVEAADFRDCVVPFARAIEAHRNIGVKHG